MPTHPISQRKVLQVSKNAFKKVSYPFRATYRKIRALTTSAHILNYVPFKPTNFKLDAPPVCTNLFLFARNTSNIGDLHSTPFDYFTFRGESSVGDFWSAVNMGEDRFDNIIVGGGAFSNNYVLKAMYYQRLRPKKNLILWGAGTDMPGRPPMSRDFIDRCSLIGTRDFECASIDNEKVLFCPCASAMSRAFDIVRPPPVHPVICYLHHNRAYNRTDLFHGYPIMHNYGDFIESLDFLASGEIVITDSYHGLYWATLLGKKVISLIDSGKFAMFKWVPAYAKIESFRNNLKYRSDINIYPEALSECRELNMAFYQKVISIL
ncbi:MAG: polysaccharide pyruvyl transferase family protein [Sphingobium sp.]|nr:polysaccharide pyruvyl transferase family protein [Sphingobium sp.]MCP5398799.1 polysaccharide pyruvyl transferase family protein [Sphingomonas sp.]